MEQEEAISKIKKLLRLSESPNQHEAEVALKKARALMLQYHVTESSLDVQDKNVVWKELPMNKQWMDTFYGLICRNNRCECYQSISRKYEGGKIQRTRTIHIVGYPFDVECVIVMAQLVEDSIKRGIAECRKSIRETVSSNTNGVTKNYTYGFYQGLKKAFDEQNAKQEFHLMCITPQEVKDELNNVANLKHSHKRRVSLNYNAGSVYAYHRGSSEGYETGLRKQIGGES